ncbi:hypothetical protein [Hymenobacter elongatus]|uniref:Lipoprotein n=1 Tax=Hymenobacter elongatus TaxID=877208 RepID=A0A4Z0PR97_9BACT|nr:hypothetical protein [Hymenobacter elongatus]TGE20035.1 hypothetical protein E5J99_00260 [Hymenobacter elongatus]
MRWSFLIGLPLFSSCTPAAPHGPAQAPCQNATLAGDWQRQNLLQCLCRSMGPAWVADFAAGHGQLVLYVAVDRNSRFYAIESFYSTSDSARIASSGFLRQYQESQATPAACWPAPQGAIQNTYDTLRLDGRRQLVRHFTIPLFCTSEKPCDCSQ